MSARYDFFGVGETLAENPYERIGFPRNPFRHIASADGTERAPFYTEHIRGELSEIARWMKEVHDERVMSPMSLVGTIGTGKTTILHALEAGLVAWPPSEKVAVYTVLLSDSGFARASVGAMLVSGLERAMEQLPMGGDKVPDDVLPLVWGTIRAASFPENAKGPLANALRKARGTDGEAKKLLAQDISNWIRRVALTPARARASGLARAIDWEGELVSVVAEALRIAHQAGVITTFFLFVDQIEELFRPTMSDVRRARILTDLRTLVDDIDGGAPIGLLLSWTPESDDMLTKKYEALASRLRRRRVQLPLLERKDANAFAQKWVDAMGISDSGKNRPRTEEIVEVAWTYLYRQKDLFDNQQRATPRMLLEALAKQVDRLAGILAAEESPGR